MPLKETNCQSLANRSKHKTSSGTSSSKAIVSSKQLTPVSKQRDSDLAIWKSIEQRISDRNAVVLVVGEPEEKKSFTHFLTDEKKLNKRRYKDTHTHIFSSGGTLGSQIIVATPNDLKKALNIACCLDTPTTEPSISTKWFSKRMSSDNSFIIPTTLLIFVSRSIKAITYEITSRIMSATVMLCRHASPAQSEGNMYPLYITQNSSYCGVEAWYWEQRREYPDQSLSHGQGIYFDISSLTTQGLSFYPENVSSMTPQAMAEIETQFRESYQNDDDDDDDDRRTGSSGSSVIARPPPTPADKEISWFKNLFSLITKVIGGAIGVTGVVASYCFTWFNSGGFFIKGPLGLYLSGGYFNAGAVGAASLRAIGLKVSAGLSAAALVYFVPWDTVLGYLKKFLLVVWDRIKEYAMHIWEKLKTTAKNVASALEQGILGNSFPHMEKPARFAT